MKKIIIIVCVLMVAACAAKKVAAVAAFSQADIDRGATKFPGTTMETLVQGKANYELHCQTCHELKPVASRSEEKWRAVVPNMVRMANKKAGKEAVDPATQESILRYVVTMATAPVK